MMNNNNSFDFVRDAMSYDNFERLTRQAHAERDAALGRGLKNMFLSVAVGFERLNRAVDQALQLRALAMLGDRQLAALDLDRRNLPNFVYGLKKGRPEVVSRDVEETPVLLDRLAA